MSTQPQQAQHQATPEAQRVLETTAATWWPTNSPTRCISCGAEHKPGQELACGH